RGRRSLLHRLPLRGAQRPARQFGGARGALALVQPVPAGLWRRPAPVVPLGLAAAAAEKLACPRAEAADRGGGGGRAPRGAARLSVRVRSLAARDRRAPGPQAHSPPARPATQVADPTRDLYPALKTSCVPFCCLALEKPLWL